MTGLRKFSPEEIRVIGGNGKFTPEELTALAEGGASFRLISKAEKLIEKHRKHMMMPYPRSEALRVFITRKDFVKHHGSLHDRVAFLTRTLVKKGLVSDDEIIQTGKEMEIEQCIDLCPACTRGSVLTCGTKKGDFQLAKDIYSTLPPELGDKMVNCKAFAPSPPEEKKGEKEG